MRSSSLLSLADVARDLRVLDAPDAYRAVIGWMDEISGAGGTVVETAIAEAPALTGDERLDALLAAAAEHAAFHADADVPDWLSNSDRFLRSAWFPIDLPSLRVRGLVSSPASFARRGIFIDRSDLDDHKAVVFDHPNLVVAAPSPEHLLAMKLQAARATGAADIRLLLGVLGIDSVGGASDVLEVVFPGTTMSDRARFVVEDILGSASSPG